LGVLESIREIDRTGKGLNVSAKFYLSFQNSRKKAHEIIHEQFLDTKNRLMYYTGLLSNRTI
jgi:hypothetical protein